MAERGLSYAAECWNMELELIAGKSRRLTMNEFDPYNPMHGDGSTGCAVHFSMLHIFNTLYNV